MQSISSISSEPALTDSSLIRSASDGRLRFTTAQRQELLVALDRSGLRTMGQSKSKTGVLVVWRVAGV